MTLEQIATPAATAALVAAVVALVRKDVPRFDGAYVLIATFVLSELASVAYMLATAPSQYPVGILNGVVAFVIASGGTSWAQQIVRAKE